MRLITWNLNARRAELDTQVAALAGRAPDVVALQEVTPTTVGPLRVALAAAGLPHAIDSFGSMPPGATPTGPRRYGLLTASRCPIEAEGPGRFALPWPERVLSAVLCTPDGRVELHNTHVPPGSSNGWVKIGQLDGLYEGLARPAALPRILCGDFNTPQEELPSGEVITWGQRRTRDGWRVARAIRGRAGAAWDAGERRVLSGLAEWDLPDIYRGLHGYGVAEASWVHRRGAALRGRRFDHVFAARALEATRCAYLHDLRERGLSDHSALEADFRWPTCLV